MGAAAARHTTATAAAASTGSTGTTTAATAASCRDVTAVRRGWRACAIPAGKLLMLPPTANGERGRQLGWHVVAVTCGARRWHARRRRPASFQQHIVPHGRRGNAAAVHVCHAHVTTVPAAATATALHHDATPATVSRSPAAGGGATTAAGVQGGCCRARRGGGRVTHAPHAGAARVAVDGPAPKRVAGARWHGATCAAHPVAGTVVPAAHRASACSRRNRLCAVPPHIAPLPHSHGAAVHVVADARVAARHGSQVCRQPCRYYGTV